MDLKQKDALVVRYPVGAGDGAYDVMPCRGTSGVGFILSGDGFTQKGADGSRLMMSSTGAVLYCADIICIVILR